LRVLMALACCSAVRPVIVPDHVVIDHGRVFVSLRTPTHSAGQDSAPYPFLLNLADEQTVDLLSVKSCP
jgi:hypothetical protein